MNEQTSPQGHTGPTAVLLAIGLTRFFFGPLVAFLGLCALVAAVAT